MRILYATTELYPFLKIGGLADVAAGLPPALRAHYEDIRLILPRFPAFAHNIQNQELISTQYNLFGIAEINLYRGVNPETDMITYLVEAGELFEREHPYVQIDRDGFANNYRCFALFSWAVAHLNDPSWHPEIIHAHDWHTALVPAWLATQAKPRPASIFTIHNLAYQGDISWPQIHELGLPESFFNTCGDLCQGTTSFMEAGLYFADHITTVSPSYAKEIQTMTGGRGFDLLLSHEKTKITGILNGVDDEIWDPNNDNFIPFSYNNNDMGGKGANKAELQFKYGLTVSPDLMMIGVVSRLVEQKGLDLLVPLIPKLVEANIQLVILGCGDPDLEASFHAATAAYPQMVHFTRDSGEAIAHQIFASSDAFVIPSRFEPCGLTQLYAMRYGTLPIVHAVGGLKDTVKDASPSRLNRHTATGFVFEEASSDALYACILRAHTLYTEHQAQWDKMRETAMLNNFSWMTAAEKYRDLYHQYLPDC